MPEIIPTWQRGHRRNFPIGPAFDNIIDSNSVLPVANYFDGLKTLFLKKVVEDGTTVKIVPICFGPILQKKQIQKQQDLPLGYPYYTLSCLDSNFEILHRVHLVIREWNTLEEFVTFQDTEGRSGDPDIEGEEGDECLYYEPDEFLSHSGQQCNDFSDIDDIHDQELPLSKYPYVLYEGSGGGS